MPLELRFAAELWRHDSPGGWHVVTVPAEVAEEIRERVPGGQGFGSRRVIASLGGSTWSTSIFPDTRSGSFLLPVKQQVRRANAVGAGDAVDITLQVDLPDGQPSAVTRRKRPGST